MINDTELNAPAITKTGPADLYVDTRGTVDTFPETKKEPPEGVGTAGSSILGDKHVVSKKHPSTHPAKHQIQLHK